MTINVDEEIPNSGLWAYFKGQFYCLEIKTGDRKTDHVSWFQSLGLPDYGPEYDKVLRGRITWDWHMDQFVLSFYGMGQLPNQVYEMVTKRFNPNGHRVIEKPISNLWY